MGLEIPQEFWPITPIRTVPTTRNHNSTNNENKKFKLPDLDKKNFKELRAEEQEEEEEEKDECRTPKSEDNLLKTPLICPPAPRKPRRTKRKHGFSSSSSSIGYFQVPNDLNSLFFPIPSVCKKIKLTV